MAMASSVPAPTNNWSRRVIEARGFPSPATQFSVDSVSASSAAEVVLAPGPSFTSSEEEFLNASSDRYPSKVVGFSSSPSSTVVMCSLEDSIGETHHDSLENSGGSSNADKKQAWGKPSNGSSEVGAPVMGEIWPSLGESRDAPKSSSSSDSLKSLTDGSLASLKGPGAASSSERQVANNTVSPSSSKKHVGPTRQRSMKRAGGSSSNTNVSENGEFFQPQQHQQRVVMKATPNNSGKFANAPAESSSSNHMPEVGGHFGSQSHCGNEQQRGHFGPQSHNGNNHHQQRNTFRRGYGGPHSRGDGSYHHSHVGSRHHDRRSQSWNPNRSFGSRDPRMQPHRFVPGGFMRPPTHGPVPFMPPPFPMQPFGIPVHYHDAASSVFYVPSPSIDSMRGVSMVMPMPPSMYFPASQLHAKIVKQIDYYFSNENLIKDMYLRQKMDNEGWVSIELIAGFKKVRELTNSIKLIVEALQTSTIVEVQGNKVRKLNDWMRWVLPHSNQNSAVPSPRSPGKLSHDDILATQLERVSLDGNKVNSHLEGYVSSS